MKEIRNDFRTGVANFIESFRDTNDDVTKFGSEKVVNKIKNERKNRYGYSSTKISERRIDSNGVK